MTAEPGAERARLAASRAVTAAVDELVGLSHRIHPHPELSFEEERAAAWCAEVLDAHGFPGEVADPCAWVADNGGTNVTLSTGTFPVTGVWSNRTNRCEVSG